MEQEVRRLKRENARLAQRLAQAEAVIEVQKKLSALLEPLHSEPFVDCAPATVYAALLNAGVKHVSGLNTRTGARYKGLSTLHRGPLAPV